MTASSLRSSRQSDVQGKSQCVVILAPTAQDAHVSRNILSDAGIEAEFCDSLERFYLRLKEDAGAALIAEEFLNPAAIDRLRHVLSRQPAWSDFPLIILLKQGDHPTQRYEELLSIGHVTLVARPLRIAVFVNTLRARLRDRMRQYTVRDLLIEREQAIETSRQDARRVELALQSGGMGAWDWSERGLYWSPQMFEIFGFPNETPPVEALIYERVLSEDRDALVAAWKQSLDKDGNFYHEFRIEHPDRGTRWIASVGEPVRDLQGKVDHYAGLSWDTTDEKLASQALEKARREAEVANQSKSEFLANMSHEIRTPMTAILGYVDLIAHHTTEPEVLEYVKTVRHNGHYLLAIINDILDLSKIEAGKFDVSAEPVAPNRIVEDVRSTMDVRARESNLALEVEYEGRIPAQIKSDPKRLRQILLNLVGNAIKFTDRGDVKLRVRYQNDDQPRLLFDIIDTGIGMTPRQTEKLFQPFSQADTSVSRNFGGTGLGLAISKRLANMLGGTIEVESEAGRGSRFTLAIDLDSDESVDLVEPSAANEVMNPNAVEEQTTIDCRILVVDDRRDIRFLSKRLLSDAGATVFEAQDGQDAVEQVQEMLHQEDLVDLILLDMQMPRLDGYRTAEQLRRMGFRNPIIALTADAMQGDMKRCLECGCNGYLSKPIDARKLLNLVNELTQPPQ